MSITRDGLSSGLTALHREWLHLDESTAYWDEVKLLNQHGTKYLRITVHLPHSRASDADHGDDGDDEPDDSDEDDPEALKVSPEDGVSVCYDIVHSPSYQVPVLYLTWSNSTSGKQLSLGELYRRLVPAVHRESLQSVGQMGAITLTEHPVTGVPAYFVHPCRTHDAMESATGRHPVTAEEYLCMWMGMIGASAGLNVPLALAKKLGSDERVAGSDRVLQTG